MGQRWIGIGTLLFLRTNKDLPFEKTKKGQDIINNYTDMYYGSNFLMSGSIQPPASPYVCIS